jgi:hypothetical protein
MALVFRINTRTCALRIKMKDPSSNKTCLLAEKWPHNTYNVQMKSTLPLPQVQLGSIETLSHTGMMEVLLIMYTRSMHTVGISAIKILLNALTIAGSTPTMSNSKKLDVSIPSSSSRAGEGLGGASAAG